MKRKTNHHITRLLTTCLTAFTLACLSPQALAATITTQESALDAIFSQASFGMNTIDIRFGAAQTIVAPDLLDITSDAEIGTLFGMHIGPANVINFFYVDSISSCGTIDPNIIGCAALNDPNLVVESSFAAGPNGAELLAHELAHNLGLDHNSGSMLPNLMDPTINGSTAITVAQVMIMLAAGQMSGILQSDASGQLFVEVIPVLVVAAVPLPAALWLLLTALGGLVGLKRLRPTQSRQTAIA